MQVRPYLFFDGRCEEAIEFYKKALGAKVATLMRYKDGPEPSIPRLAVRIRSCMRASV
jgi:PhnB protein